MLNASTFYYKKAIVYSAICSGLLFIIIGILGHTNTFLLFNKNMGIYADYFFNYITYLGDGAVWVILLILCLLYAKKYWVLLVSSFTISTLITHFFKQILLPHQPRPTLALQNQLSQIHTIKGIEVHTIGSFPSGHTTSVFCYFLLLSFFIKKNIYLWLAFAVTLLTAYSRVYQAQHFPTDVAAGILAAIITVQLSLFIQKKTVGAAL